MKDVPIPFVDLQAQRARLEPGMTQSITRVLEHGGFIHGPEVKELEGELSGFTGAQHAVACGNGTDALVLALMALGVTRGDAVFVPSFTFAATAEAVGIVGATPCFVDVALPSFNLDPASLAGAVEAAEGLGLRPRAVIPVDLFGHPADYDAIGAVAEAAGLSVIGDAAQSLGASWQGRAVGSLADITTTSFFPSKPLGCYGDGGAVFTDDDEIAQTLRSLRVHGQGADKYENVRLGTNSRLDTIQAAVLLQKLAVFTDELTARDRVAARYAEQLGDVVDVPTVASGARSAWAQYTIRLERRDEVQKALSAAGVPTAIYYPRPLHRQPPYASCPTAPDGMRTTESIVSTVLSLPIHPYLSEQDQDHVVVALRDAVSDES